ncbi:MAG: ABC transporter ATP-binding protein/permease [Cyanobacteria bacterium]|nr:ABC transporter ATP-binding protein/permease [Cyanobacteriota bacterium]MDW8200557.1 ABC transporter ATP-binding protein [Cyanobacteriota bacterium SKYGB_h_bin112]
MAQSRFHKLIEYLRPHWQATIAGILAILIVNILGVLIPLVIRSSVNRLQTTNRFADVLQGVLLIVGMASLMWAIRIVSRMLLFGTGRQVEYDLKQKMFNHLLGMEPAYFATNTAGDLISRFTSDVDNIRRLLGFAVLSFVNTLFAYGLTLPVMLSINLRLSLLAISVYPLMLVLVKLFSERLRSEQLEVQQRLSDMSDLIQEDVSGIALIKIYAQEENERAEFRRLNQQLLTANLTLAKTRNLLFPMLIGIASLSYLILLWLGAGAIAANTLTVGDFVALLLYIERLIFPTALLGFTITAYQRGEVSIDRIEAVLSNRPKIVDAPDAVTLAPESASSGDLNRLTTKALGITARHLTYTYPGAPYPALKDVNFTIHPGEMVAIVGPVGSGKSTLANALPRLLDVAPNQLFLGGYDITKLRLADLRGAIAYVPQDSFLFSTSIKDNIRYGAPQSELSQVEAAAKEAQIHTEIINFPQQYETIVGERGITLSGGQRQRTALARALLVDAPVLILDDALSSVDNQTATQILENLAHGTSRKTVIFISHQLSVAALADRILVMDQGQVVQSGSHTELLHQPGLYQYLWSQYKLQEVLS